MTTGQALDCLFKVFRSVIEQALIELTTTIGDIGAHIQRITAQNFIPIKFRVACRVAVLFQVLGGEIQLLNRVDGIRHGRLGRDFAFALQFRHIDRPIRHQTFD